MNTYEIRFYEDINKLLSIQKEILEELKKINKPLEVEETYKNINLTENEVNEEVYE